MNFNHLSYYWSIGSCRAEPGEVVQDLISAIAKYLPDKSLGHVKGYAVFDDGTVFGSSTLIPPVVTLHQEGDYRGGGIEVYMTLIFSGLDIDTLRDALEKADEQETLGKNWIITDKGEKTHER